MCGMLNKMECVKSMKNGIGIQHLLNEAYKILENPIVMFNTEYNLLAHTDGSTDDPIWNDITTNGSFSHESRVFFAEVGFVDTVAGAKTTTFLTSDKLKYDRILGKLYNKNHIHVANLVLAEYNRPFESDDAQIFEAVCEVFSKEIVNSEFYQTYGVIYQETYIRKLIEGAITDKELYSAHIEIIYDGLKANLHLAVADIGKCDPGHTKLSYYRDLFSKTQPSFKYSIYSKYIIIIINSDDLRLDVKKDLHKLIRIFEQNNIYVGISRRFENLYELAKRYIEAVNALNSGMAKDDSRRIFLSGEVEGTVENLN